MRKFTTGQRLKELMKTQGLRQVDILNKTRPYQESLGITMLKSHLSNYVNDRSKPDRHKMRLLSKSLDVSEPWLMGYDIDPSSEVTKGFPVTANENEVDLLQTYRELTLPHQEEVHALINSLLSAQQTAATRATQDEKIHAQTSDTVLTFKKKDGTVIYPNVIGAAAGVGTSHYADLDLDEIMIPNEEAYEHTHVIPMYVRGDSMEPKYFNGDIIWVDTHNKSINLHQIGVFDTEDGRVVKKMGTDKLISINSKYPDIKLHEYMDFSTYGKVVDVIRSEQLEIWQNASWV